MNKTKKGNLTLTAKMLQEMLVKTVQNELEEIPDKYNKEPDELENMEVTIYVKEKERELHKGGRTLFMKVYEKETKLLFKNKVVDFKEFGFLTFLGSLFTSYEDNVLKNKDGTPMTQKDIVEASGMTRATISPLLKKLIEKKLLVEEIHSEITNGKMYYLNPMVFYKGTLMSEKRKAVFKQVEQGILDEWSGKKGSKLTANNLDKINQAVHAIAEVEESFSEAE